MTLTSEPQLDTQSDTEAPSSRLSAAEQARRRRARRHARMIAPAVIEPLLSRARTSGYKLPFLVLLVGLLGFGLVGVLWLNTFSDEAGIRANEARKASATLQLQIQGLNTDIAAKQATPALAEAARRMGLVPAGDAAILIVPTSADAAPTVLGTPTAVVDPAVIAAQEQAAAAESAAAAAAAAQSAADQAAAAQSAAALSSQAATSAAVDPNAGVVTTTTADVIPVGPADGQPADTVVTTGTGAAG